MSAPLCELASAELSDIGRKRKNNEDSVLRMPEFGVFCVADGMGGADAGEVASGKTVEFIRNAFACLGNPATASASQKGRVACKALKDASQWIWKHSIEHGMRCCGTTAVVMAFDSGRLDRALVLHAGDSRAYRFRGGRIEKLTRDHSLAAATGVDDERLLPPGFQGIITRAVGIAEGVSIEETPVDVAERDVFLLCSDGLNRMVTDSRIEEIMNQHRAGQPGDIAEHLVREANDAGGLDNTSVILIRVDRPRDSADERATPTGKTTGWSDAMTETGAQPGGRTRMDPAVKRGFRRRVVMGMVIIAALVIGLALTLAV